MLYKDIHTGEIIDAETLKKEIENSGEYPCFIDGIIDELIDTGAIVPVKDPKQKQYNGGF